MEKIAAPIPFAGSQIDQPRHVCAFFNSPDEEYRVLLPFIKDGFQCGHKAVHIVNRDKRQDHLQRLTAAGIDTAVAEQSGQLEIRTDTEVYLPDGRFNADRMISTFEHLVSGNGTEGFPLRRICCHMDWAVESGSHVDDVIEFESRVNEVWLRHEDAVVCTYDLSKFAEIVGTDNCVFVPTPNLIYPRLEFNHIIHMRSAFNSPIHTTTNAP